MYGSELFVTFNYNSSVCRLTQLELVSPADSSASCVKLPELSDYILRIRLWLTYQRSEIQNLCDNNSVRHWTGQHVFKYAVWRLPCLGAQVSGMWRCVVWWGVRGLTRKIRALICEGTAACPWRQRYYDHAKRRKPPTQSPRATSSDTLLWELVHRNVHIALVSGYRSLHTQI